MCYRAFKIYHNKQKIQENILKAKFLNTEQKF